VVLVGMMGTGKTAVGRLLAKRLKRPFIDTDRLVEEREGCSVAQLFRTKGEAYFREVETTVIREAVEKAPSVIATGGGALLRQETREALTRRGLLVWLKAELDEMVRRTAKRPGARPLLTAGDPSTQLQQLLVEREPFYAQAALNVDTTGKSIDEVASMILNGIEEVARGRQEGP
jgi:shikimate kinase